MYQHPNKGILAGIAAGCFWGTPFIAPMILSSFSPFEITFGRFLVFGLISLLSLSSVLRMIKNFNRKQIIKVVLLSSAGFWFYTLILFAGVKSSNGVIASLIVGCLPLTMCLFSKPKFNAILIVGLTLIIAGMIFLLVIPMVNHDQSLSGVKISGIILLFVALLTWTWFGIQNSYFMHENQHIKSMDYSSLIGLINLAIILPAFAVTHGFNNLLHHQDLTNFVIWSIILGVGASWIANILWAYSAKNCSPSIGGALIVSETIFGVIYSFIYTERLPYSNEMIAVISLVAGVIFVIRSQR